ncbi:hypothetical protein Tco_0043030, partial [Tanacetum coccineum]
IASVPLSSPILRALSFAHADLLPSPKRFRSPESATDLEDSSAESSEPSRSKRTDLEMDVDVERSDMIDIDPEIQLKINECPVEVRVDRVTHLVVADDILEPAQEGAVEVIESVQRDHGHKIIATGQQSADMLERIRELERDNRILKDVMDVASQRVAQS